jgi:hypothetical protein
MGQLYVEIRAKGVKMGQRGVEGLNCKLNTARIYVFVDSVFSCAVMIKIVYYYNLTRSY